jgi:hypothetical protein
MYDGLTWFNSEMLFFLSFPSLSFLDCMLAMQSSYQSFNLFFLLI